CLPRDSVNCTAFVAGTPYSTIFPGGQIPTSFFDPVSASLLDKYIPHPNHGSKTFVNSPVQPDDTYQVTLKLDQQVNDNNKLSAFYYLNDDSVHQESALPGFPVDFKFRAQNLSIKDLWIVTPKTFNEFGIGFLRQAGVNVPTHGAFPASYGFTG